jgi:hypothetical protein
MDYSQAGLELIYVLDCGPNKISNLERVANVEYRNWRGDLDRTNVFSVGVVTPS